MPITLAAAGDVEQQRRRLLADLAERREANPGFRVLDVGGAYNPWADEQTDAYIDLKPVATDKRVVVGDICTPALWDQMEVSGERFDFSICSHVLEDIRDPLFVIERLQRVSRAGFVAMPTKHSELSHVESDFYLGYCHHRWIYTVVGDGDGDGRRLGAVAKFPVVGYFVSRWRPLLKLVHLLGRSTLLAKVERRLGIFPAGSGVGWVRRDLAGHDQQLGVWWESDLPFDFLAGDYAGNDCLETADLYRQVLEDGI